MNQAPGNEIPDTLSDLDWHHITCQSDAGLQEPGDAHRAHTRRGRMRQPRPRLVRKPHQHSVHRLCANPCGPGSAAGRPAQPPPGRVLPDMRVAGAGDEGCAPRRLGAVTSKPLVADDGDPVVADADHCPALRLRLVERLFGAGGVGEFAVASSWSTSRHSEALAAAPGSAALAIATSLWPGTL